MGGSLIFITIQKEVNMTHLTPFDPFAELRALQKQFFNDDWLATDKGAQLATTDVYEKDNKLVVEAHLGQFEDDDVDVSVDNGVLTVSAEKHEKQEDKDKKYVLRESSSSFYRRLRLPERALADNIEAHMEGGVLKVTVPLEELPQPKKIQIKAGKKKK